MAEATKHVAWIPMIGGTVLGLLTGSITVYNWLESRIEAKVLTEVRIKELELAQKTLKDACWTADEAINKTVSTLQTSLARLEVKMDNIQSAQAIKPTTTSTTP